MTADATPTPLQDLIPGSSFGAYRINRMLGRGGMGAVYEAVHQGDGRVVALKLLSVELDNMDSRQRFLREGQTAAAINHPNAVYIYGTEEIDGVPVISMELVPGGTLEEKVKERGPLPVAEAVEDILQVVDGLDAALAAGVLHRDVKPANCFVNAVGVVKIGDFGLSKPVDSAEQQKLTQTGVFLGTPVFSSPEQLLGEKLDQRSDIYAVGVTFYYLLTGQLPYQSGSMMQVIAAVLNGEPAPLTTHRQGLPQAVVDVVMKAIARKTADRYQSYDEFRAAVVALRAPETSPATLWDRFRAAVVDAITVALIDWVLFWSIMWITGKSWTSTTPDGMKLNAVLSLVVSLLIIAIPEGLRGASIGKWLIGIRVARVDGRIPGLPRAVIRVAILQAISFLALIAQLSTANINAKAAYALLVSLGLRALLLSTVRRSNGWMMVHDWVTGTRVIRRLAGVQQRHGAAQRKDAPSLSGSERRIGPYAVLGPSHEGSAVLLGWDESMHRSVWIVPQEPNAPEVSQARRDLARLTRLRWVAGRRSAGDCWDAYEAPLGEPLATRLQRRVAWNVQQEWMLDLTGELLAAAADGTMPAALSVQSLWVTPADRIVVPDTGGLVGDGVRDSIEPLPFIVSVLDLVREGTRKSAPLPRYAALAFSAARNARSLEDVHALFKDTVGRPVKISRARRTGLVAATMAVVLFLPIAGIVPLRQQAKSDPDGRRLSGLLQFIGDSIHAQPESLRVKVPKKGGTMTKLNRALQKAGWYTSDTALDRLSPEAYQRQSRLAQIYVAATLSARARDTLSSSVFGRSPPDQRLAKTILERFAKVDSTDLRAARALVDSTWQGNPPGTSVDLLLKVVSAVLFVFFPWFIAGCAIVIGVLFRRGPLMRGFQLDVVTKDGEPAGRLRILLRNIVTWSPVGAPIVMYFAIVVAPPGRAGLAVAGAGVLVLIALAIGVWIAIRTPERGIADRVAGTYLVPE
jgi:uncharacterized RDD family membrane protein YckC